MNVLESSLWSKTMEEISGTFARPSAVLVVSAHWLTQGFRISASANPPQIRDFFGFPRELYEVEYKAPGDPVLAHRAASLLSAAGFPCHEDVSRGIDHAGWAVMWHLYPDHDIPLLELSIDYRLPYAKWFDVGKALSPLREQGVLLVGSGNIVHNLYEVDYETMSHKRYPWSIAFNELVKQKVAERDWKSLASYATPIEVSARAVPTPDHYIPLLATAGMLGEGEDMRVFHESFQNGSVAMTSYIIR
jgi:4,5-DOPA dioxygenase extradiol